MSVGSAGLTSSRAQPDQLARALAIVQDIGSYEERLTKLLEAEDRLKKATAKYGKATEIDKMNAAARTAVEKANKKLSDAEGEAAKVLSEAASQAKQERSALAKQRATFNKRKKETEESLSDGKSSLAAAEGDFAIRLKDVGKREADAEIKRVAAEDLTRDLRQRLRKLQKAISDVGQV